MRIVKAGACAAALVAAVGVATRLQAQSYFGQNQVQAARQRYLAKRLTCLQRIQDPQCFDPQAGRAAHAANGFGMV